MRLKKLLKCHRILIFILMILMVFLGINFLVKYTSNKKCYRDLSSVPTCEAGIVLGAAVHGKTPSKYLEDRLEAAIDLYKNGKVQKLLLTGDHGNEYYNELIVMKQYCASRGVDTARIYLDYAGFDTYSSLYRAKHIFNVEKVIVVSQNYHIDRAVFIGNRLGIDCYGYAADKGSYHHLRKNVVREYMAVVKAVIDLTIKRKPKFLGETIDINGKSNYSK